MCIIVAKEKGLELPKKDVLETCFENNPDGAGFMYVKDNKVVIDKGYMNFKDFYKRLQKLDKKLHLKNKALVMHFRIGTHGANDKATTHPFPISNNASDLRKTYFTTDLGMAHNGVISNYTYDKSLSDTQVFIRDLVSVLKELNKNFYKNKSTLDMLSELTGSRLCFLDTKENIIYVGKFVKDSETGIRYSNDTYQYSWRNWQTYEYPKKTIKWDDDYDEYDYKDEYDDYDYTTKRLTIDEFVREYKNYRLLNEGDILELSDNDIWQIEVDGTYFLTENGDVYEYMDGITSLVCTDAKYIDEYNRFSLSEC